MKLGDTLTITQIYKRRTRQRYNERHTYPDTLKVWEPWTIKPRAAIFLGWRTLSNGVRDWEDEIGAIFTPDADGYIKAALVCFSTRENPVYVPLEGMEATKHSGQGHGDVVSAEAERVRMGAGVAYGRIAESEKHHA